MEGWTEKDNYDIEMILGEIPSAISTSSYFEDYIPTNSLDGISMEEENNKLSLPFTFTNFNNASKVTNPSRNTPFFGGQMNETLEGGKITMKNDHQSPFIMSVDNEDSNISNHQSLTSAFTQLNLKDGVAMEPTSLAEVNYKTLNSGSTAISSFPLPNTLNVTTFVNPTVDGLDKVKAEMNSQESGEFLKLDDQELRNQKSGYCQQLEKLSSDLGEQQQSLPVYSGAMPLAPGTLSYQVLSNVPVTGVEFSVMPHQQPFLLDEQYSIPCVQPQQLRLSHDAWLDTDEEQYCRMYHQQLWQLLEEEKHRKMHQQHLYLQQLWNQRSESYNPIHGNANGTIRPITRNERQRQPYFESTMSHHLVQANKDPFGHNATIQKEVNPSDLTLMGSGSCSYCAQGFYGSGEGCPFAHCHKQTSLGGFGHFSHPLYANNFEADQFSDKVGKQTFPEKIQTKSHELSSLNAIRTGPIGGHRSPNYANFNGRLLPNGNFHHHQSILSAGSLQLDSRPSLGFSPDHVDLKHNNMRSQLHKYNSVDEVIGRIYFMAKDQYGCRFLQRKFTEGSAEDVNKIFVEIIGHIVELMTDPFGNYLVQKLLEVCNEDQMMHILNVITRNPGDLVRISRDSHGTRVVQKIIETIKTPEQFSIVVSLLKPDIVKLAKDMHGNHVAQRCLQYLQPEYSEFLFEAATAHFIELAKDRHGCCVLQKCLSHSDGKRRCLLIFEIISNALLLSEDQFGNYVVQYVFELQVPWATAKLLDQLDGNYGSLSMQKFSSNVVEKCLKYAGEEHRRRIIHELMTNSQFDQILHNPYGNYVIQAALEHSKGALHASLVEAIKPYVPALRTNPFGKKVLSRINLKK